MIATTGNSILTTQRGDGRPFGRMRRVPGQQPVNDCANCVQLNWLAGHNSRAVKLLLLLLLDDDVTSVAHQLPNQHRIEHAAPATNLTTAFDYQSPYSRTDGRVAYYIALKMSVLYRVKSRGATTSEKLRGPRF